MLGAIRLRQPDLDPRRAGFMVAAYGAQLRLCWRGLCAVCAVSVSESVRLTCTSLAIHLSQVQLCGVARSHPSFVVVQRTDDHSVDTPSSRPPTSKRPRSSSSPSSHYTPVWPSPSRSCSLHTAVRWVKAAARRRVKLRKTTPLRMVRVSWLGCFLVFECLRRWKIVSHGRKMEAMNWLPSHVGTLSTVAPIWMDTSLGSRLIRTLPNAPSQLWRSLRCYIAQAIVPSAFTS